MKLWENVLLGGGLCSASADLTTPPSLYCMRNDYVCNEIYAANALDLGEPRGVSEPYVTMSLVQQALTIFT